MQKCLHGCYITASLAALALASQAAHAQTTPAGGSPTGYPVKTVRVTVGFAPGGGVDVLARVVAQKLSDNLGRSFVVENRPGAGGTLAYAAVAKLPPDGYSLLAISGAYSMSSALYARLPYDPIRDFAPLTLTGVSPFLLVTHPSVPVKTAADLIALAKAKPGAIDFASGGFGSSGHLTGELFKSMAGIRMNYVSYRGAEPALIDLIAGQVQIVFSSIVSSLPHVRSGRVRALGVTGPSRYARLPNIPTVAESGLPGFDATNWYGWLAPAGTPTAIVRKLNAEIGATMKLPDVRERLAGDGAEPAVSTPEQFGERLAGEIVRWRKVVADAGLRVE